jgi:EamA domain-containing membrane protein RarD
MLTRKMKQSTPMISIMVQIVYKVYIFCRELIHRSKNRTASMDLFAELIGALSNIRFVSVSDRFIAELEKYNYHAIMKEKQNKIEMLIRGMRYLKIKVRTSSRMLCCFVAQCLIVC